MKRQSKQHLKCWINEAKLWSLPFKSRKIKKEGGGNRYSMAYKEAILCTELKTLWHMCTHTLTKRKNQQGLLAASLLGGLPGLEAMPSHAPPPRALTQKALD